MSDFQKTTIFSILSSERSRKLFEIIIESGLLTSIEIHNKYIGLYGQTNRETTYRELEKLQNGGILNKKYDQIKKKLMYENNMRSLNLTIREGKLDFDLDFFEESI